MRLCPHPDILYHRLPRCRVRTIACNATTMLSATAAAMERSVAVFQQPRRQLFHERATTIWLYSAVESPLLQYCCNVGPRRLTQHSEPAVASVPAFQNGALCPLISHLVRYAETAVALTSSQTFPSPAVAVSLQCWYAHLDSSIWLNTVS
jgi:hypothetical protein